eukprot:CAMPEP_0116881460 /NCGR_PEP_ID=MMETSP0463-20121206/13571_1 /TAXON_ID=181622 /ORGANISM="Strombidinopsis sp, Strain SopsisLIS2011" /LENGTH=87 /DNA_ID=CAMNT_0004533425 /DNA_START=883 /DNA_END=1146 /DNA_ORIENTATION=+
MDLIVFLKEQRKNNAIRRVRFDKFDQMFGKTQASNVIDLNYSTSSSGGAEESADDLRTQLKNMKQVIESKETLTSADMMLLKGVLLD